MNDKLREVMVKNLKSQDVILIGPYDQLIEAQNPLNFIEESNRYQIRFFHIIKNELQRKKIFKRTRIWLGILSVYGLC